MTDIKQYIKAQIENNINGYSEAVKENRVKTLTMITRLYFDKVYDDINELSFVTIIKDESKKYNIKYDYYKGDYYLQFIIDGEKAVFKDNGTKKDLIALVIGDIDLRMFFKSRDRYDGGWVLKYDGKDYIASLAKYKNTGIPWIERPIIKIMVS